MVRGKRRYAKKRLVRAKKAPKISLEKRMRKIALSVVHKQAENKVTIQNLSSLGGSLIYGSGIDWNGATLTNGLVFTNVIPIITQGSGTGAREGNKVSPRYLQIRGVINTSYQPTSTLPPTGVLYSPFYVHMFIYRLKGNIFNSDLTRLLQGGTAPGTALPFDGTLLRSTYPINTDAYTVYKHRVFKMSANPQQIFPAITTPFYGDGYGNGFKMAHIFKQNIKIKKSWKYDDSVTNYPTNDNMFVAFAIVNADGSINDPTAHRATVNCESVLEFEDV